eukprot:717417_1
MADMMAKDTLGFERSVSIEPAKPATRTNISINTVNSMDGNPHHCASDFDDDDDLSDYRVKKGYESLSQIDRNATSLAHDDYISHKWITLFKRSAFKFWTRIVTLVLTMILLTLSTAYCIAQLIDVELNIVDLCEPKSRDEIWQIAANLAGATDPQLTYETQYGWNSNESCLTTRKIYFNEDNLWYGNHYKHHWLEEVEAKCIWFGLLAVYCVIILIYTLITLLFDILFVKRNCLHTKSRQFDHHLNHKSKDVSNPNKTEKLYKNCLVIYQKYLGVDTVGWVIWMFINEMIEIVIQSNALLLYNGYNILDTTHSNAVYTATKPQFIVLFAGFIALNCFGSGFVWLSHGMLPKYCHGLLFKVSLFFVDQFSDLVYSVFPFIVVLGDEYNDNTVDGRLNIWVLFGQLNINSFLAFIAAFFPLFVLCTKCLQIVQHSRKALHDQYFNEWRYVRDLSKQNNTAMAVYQANLQGLDVNAKALDDNQEIYDHKGKLQIDIKSTKPQSTNDMVSAKRNLLVTITALSYIIYGILILVLVTGYLNQSEAHCHLIKESNYFHDINGSITMDNVTLSKEEIHLLQQNPELFLYDKCLYKMYPFTNNEKTKCQCKVLVIENWTELKSDKFKTQRKSVFNLTQQDIMIGMLQTWFMLEKFRTYEVSDNSWEVQITLDPSMFKAKNMKAFEWRYCNIVLNQHGISNWKQIQYLKFESIKALAFTADDIGQLNHLKQLSLFETGVRQFSEQICNMTNLEILQFRWNIHLEVTSVPHCISNLRSLKQLSIDGEIHLVDVPLSMFGLPQLLELTLFHASVSYDTLIEYNVDTNDSNQINDWLDTNFKWNEDTVYWLQRNPICQEDTNSMHSKIASFLKSDNTKCHDECTDYYGEPDIAACLPYRLGDGHCDMKCNTPYCAYDKGDCVQLCFANNTEYTNCTWDKYTNDVCDAGCDNQYCVGFLMTSNFEVLNKYFGLYADNEHCVKGEWADQYHAFDSRVKSTNCSTSRSVYVEWDNDKQHKECSMGEWLNDGVCDDACRTKSCGYDGSDCDQNCSGEEDLCVILYSLWTSFLGTTQYKFGHDYMCSTAWPIAVSFLEIPQNVSCMAVMENADYNNDGMTNFREFVIIGIPLVREGMWALKATQVNCSACMGVEHYNY